MKAAIDTRAGPKRKRRLLQRRSQELRSVRSYQDMARIQAFATWEREVTRLAVDYFRTGREIHLAAFKRHVRGMLKRLRRPSL